MACKKLQITEDNVKSFSRSKIEISPNGIKSTLERAGEASALY